MTDVLKGVGVQPQQAAPAGVPGPRALPTRLGCAGCPALKTEDWVEHLENDETDRGTYAVCGVNDKNISSYWNDGHPVPAWCPASATPPQQAPASEPYPGYHREIERAILELSEAMGSPATFGKQPQSLLSQIVRLAAHRLKQAPAPQRVGLTQAQRIRLWNNSPQFHGDVVGRDAFERLVKFIEKVHGIGIPAPQATQEKTR